MAHIQRILAQKTKDMDEDSKKTYFLAEKICRREYEKKFSLNLNLPVGHPKNFMALSLENLFELLTFWDGIKDKYIASSSEKLALAIANICEHQTTAIFNLYKGRGFI